MIPDLRSQARASSGASPPVTLREAQFDDYSQVLALVRKFHLKHKLWIHWVPALLWIHRCGVHRSTFPKTHRTLLGSYAYDVPRSSRTAKGLTFETHIAQYRPLHRLWASELPSLSCVENNNWFLLERAWIFSWAILALLTTAFVASADEWHHSKIPSRHGGITDVMLDSSGAPTEAEAHRFTW